MNFNEYQEKARSTAMYMDKIPGILYPVLGLSGETGEVCEKVKKLYRDKDGQIDEAFRDNLKKELGDVMWYLANIAVELDLSLDDVAQTNIDKLFSRKERGVLQGSGDNR